MNIIIDVIGFTTLTIGLILVYGSLMFIADLTLGMFTKITQ